MKLLHRILIILPAMACVAASAQDSTVIKGRLSLEQCVQTALKNNLEVQQGKLQSMSGKINWNQAKLNLLPTLNGNAGSGINQGRSIDPYTNSYSTEPIDFSNYGLGAQLVIFNGGALRNNIGEKSLTYQATVQELQQAKENLAISVLLAYLQVLSTEDLLVQARAQASLSTEQVRRLEVLDSSGAISPYELEDLRGQLANDELSILTAKNDLETAKLSLCKLMNVRYSDQLKVERLDSSKFTPRDVPQAESVVTNALTSLPGIRAADLRYRSAGKSVGVYRGALFPRLTVNGDASTNYSSNARSQTFLNYQNEQSEDYVMVGSNSLPVYRKVENFDSRKIDYGKQLNNNLFTSFSLNLTLPLFNGLQARNNIRLAKIEQKNQELISATTKNTIQQAVQQAFINLVTARERQEVLLRQVAAFGASFQSAEIRFNAGLGNSVDYLTAKNNYDRSKTNLINAQYDRVLKNMVLQYYNGEDLFP